MCVYTYMHAHVPKCTCEQMSHVHLSVYVKKGSSLVVTCVFRCWYVCLCIHKCTHKHIYVCVPRIVCTHNRLYMYVCHVCVYIRMCNINSCLHDNNAYIFACVTSTNYTLIQWFYIWITIIEAKYHRKVLLNTIMFTSMLTYMLY